MQHTSIEHESLSTITQFILTSTVFFFRKSAMFRVRRKERRSVGVKGRCYWERARLTRGWTVHLRQWHRDETGPAAVRRNHVTNITYPVYSGSNREEKSDNILLGRRAV